ncbi:MAG: hypothetical protein WCG87_13350 [Bacteroidota bacterium]
MERFFSNEYPAPDCAGQNYIENIACKNLLMAQEYFDNGNYKKSRELSNKILTEINKHSPVNTSSRKFRYNIYTYTSTQGLILKSTVYEKVSSGDLTDLSSYSGKLVSKDFGSKVGTITINGHNGDKDGVVKDHLHISISNGADYDRHGWGYDKSCESIKKQDYVDPLDYIIMR